MQKIRTQLLTTAALLALTGTTYAADMAVRKAPAPPPPPPAFSWTGFYVGIAGGAGWGTIESQINSLSITAGGATIGPFNVGDAFNQNQINGWLFGVQAGYNWQATPWLVLGIEGDWDWADINGTSPCENPANFGIIGNNFSCHNKVKWTADIAARVGFSVDHALVYAKGGVAWADTDFSASCHPTVGGALIGCFLGPFGSAIPVNFSTSDTRVGGLLGAGVEYAFLPNWSAKIEYDFMDFGTKNLDFSSPFIAPGVVAHANTSEREVIHTVKVGVNYRFDWGTWGTWGH